MAELNWIQRGLMRIVDSGEIPEHIAIIMDGNRRYARKYLLPKVGEGHREGAEKLKQVIKWLSVLHGVKELTVYAFSLLNLNRAKDEVKDLMDLAESTFKEMADNPQFFEDHNCKIRFIGRVDHEELEERVKVQIKRVEEVGPTNPEFILNICTLYTSHDEIEQARDDCLAKNIEPTYENVFSHLELPSKPDLLIRTSGVYRMSNFLLMQCANTPIVVTEKLWPEISFYDFVKILIQFQIRNYLP